MFCMANCVSMPVKCEDVTVISLHPVLLRPQSHRFDQLHLTLPSSYLEGRFPLTVVSLPPTPAWAGPLIAWLLVFGTKDPASELSGILWLSGDPPVLVDEGRLRLIVSKLESVLCMVQ